MRIRKLGEPLQKMHDMMFQLCQICGQSIDIHEVVSINTSTEHTDFTQQISYTLHCP